MLRLCPSCGWQSKDDVCPHCQSTTIWTQPPKITVPGPNHQLPASTEQPFPGSWIWSVALSLLTNWIGAYLGYSVYACLFGFRPHLDSCGCFFCSTTIALLLAWTPRSIWKSFGATWKANAILITVLLFFSFALFFVLTHLAMLAAMTA
jgi:hypothetical protein